MAVRKTTKDFIKQSKDIHKDRYDYSMVNYINNKTKVEIICKEHGIFKQIPKSHLIGKGCKKCQYKNKTKENNTFIEECIKTHKKLYDYSITKYVKYNKKVKIICKEHGIFEQLPYNHICGNGCPFCRGHKNINFKDKKLYILYDSEYNLFKIGFSYNTKVRLNRIIMDTKNKNIEIYKIFEKLAIIEKDIHLLYKENRVNHPIKHNGYTEWFNLKDNDLHEIVKFIENHTPLS